MEATKEQEQQLTKWLNYYKPNYRLVEKKKLRNSKFWLVFGAIGLILIAVNTAAFIWLISNDKLDGMIKGFFYSNVTTEVDVDNQYDFSPTTNNQYKTNNNFTIVNNNYINCGNVT